MIWLAWVLWSVFIAGYLFWSREPLARAVRVWLWTRRIEWEAWRRERAHERARRAADFALASDYRRADRLERRAVVELVSIAVVVVGLVVAVILAGCGGAYPLMPSLDAGADVGADVGADADTDVGVPACPPVLTNIDTCTSPYSSYFCCQQCYVGDFVLVQRPCDGVTAEGFAVHCTRECAP